MKQLIKLKDLKSWEWDDYKIQHCDKSNLDTCMYCPLKIVNCSKSIVNSSWINNKEKFSENFLNQRIEIETPILTETERIYLMNVIEPFLNNIDYVIKKQIDNMYILRIYMKNQDLIKFPLFSIDKNMYRGLEVDKKYSLKDLLLDKKLTFDI